MQIIHYWRLRLIERKRPLAVGAASGGIGLIVSYAGRPAALGRPLADPLPVLLALGQIFRGPLYIHWQGVILHLLFAAGLGLLSTFIFRWQGRPFTTGQAALAGQTAALLNLAVIALTEIDAVIVAIWYGMSGLLSLLVTAAAARLFAAGLGAAKTSSLINH